MKIPAQYQLSLAMFVMEVCISNKLLRNLIFKMINYCTKPFCAVLTKCCLVVFIFDQREGNSKTSFCTMAPHTIPEGFLLEYMYTVQEDKKISGSNLVNGFLI